MFVNTHLFKRSLNIVCLILVVASASVAARSEGLSGLGGAVGNAVGGAVKGVGGTLGTAGGALKSGLAGVAGSRSVDSSLGDGNNADNAAAGQSVARSGNWVGAPLIMKRTAHVEDEDSCGNGFLDFLRSRNCQDMSRDGENETVEQVSGSDAVEPAVPEIQTEVQLPIREKPTSPKSMALLNADQPAGGKGEVAAVPKSQQPKTIDQGEPKSPLLSCDKAGNLVSTYGFSDIKPSDCDGNVLSFNARRDGRPFLITLNAQSGELVKVLRLPPQAVY